MLFDLAVSLSNCLHEQNIHAVVVVVWVLVEGLLLLLLLLFLPAFKIMVNFVSLEAITALGCNYGGCVYFPILVACFKLIIVAVNSFCAFLLHFESFDKLTQRWCCLTLLSLQYNILAVWVIFPFMLSRCSLRQIRCCLTLLASCISQSLSNPAKHHCCYCYCYCQCWMLFEWSLCLCFLIAL